MIPHFLGGVVVYLSLTSLFILLNKKLGENTKLFLVFVATIVWEIFEIYLDNTFGVEYARNFDSLSDICLGILGAISVSFLTGKKDKTVYNNINEE